MSILFSMVEAYEHPPIQRSLTGISGEVSLNSDGKQVATTGFYVSNKGIVEIGPSGSIVFVDLEHQRKGLGKKVCEEALRVAKEQAIKNGYHPTKATMQIAEINTPAQRLAVSLGYRKTGEDYIDNIQTYELNL